MTRLVALSELGESARVFDVFCPWLFFYAGIEVVFPSAAVLVGGFVVALLVGCPVHILFYRDAASRYQLLMICSGDYAAADDDDDDDNDERP